MGFLKNLFKFGKEYDYDYDDDYDYDLEYEDPDWDKMAGDREPLDLNDPNVQEQYVRSCLEQLKTASSDIERLNREYDEVTNELTDMEEVESIPRSELKEIEEIANHIKQLRAEHDLYVLKQSSMTDKEYKMVERYESEIARACDRLEAEEEYKKKVKKDLARLDKEKHAYNYRKRELESAIENSRGTCIVIMGAAVVLVIILFLMQTGLELDVRLGYYITIGLVAVALTTVYVKYSNFTTEKAKVANTINELILLENKVKIRYVNNKNLLDYLYLKYNVPDAHTLRDLYSRFEQEREARTRFEKNEVVYKEELANLVKRLRKYRIKNPEAWIHHVDALVDQREMVEARHSLIARRQKLRKQMEYNQTLAEEASEAIKDVTKEHPESAERILELVNIYESEKGE